MNYMITYESFHNGIKFLEVTLGNSEIDGLPLTNAFMRSFYVTKSVQSFQEFKYNSINVKILCCNL